MVSIIKKNLIFSLGFGIIMGIVFPVFASFFVNFKSSTLKTFFVSGCIAAGILVGGVSFVITKLTILKVIKEITAGMKEIRDSDSGKLDDLFNQYNPNDELGRLISEFRIFVENYSVMNRKIADSSRLTLEMGEKMMSKLDQIFTETNTISRAIENINLRQQEQMSVIDDTTGAFDQLNKVILENMSAVIELISNIDIFRSSIVEQSDLLEEIFMFVDVIEQKLITGNGTESSLGTLGKQMAADTMTAFADTGKEIDIVGTALQEIDDISSQTNLLAINTSIEAAKKGLEASGFRVIADEIRKLSSGTADTSERISQVISKLTTGFAQNKEQIFGIMTDFNTLLDSANEQITTIVMKKGELIELKEKVQTGQFSIHQLFGDLQESMKYLKEVSGSSRTNMNKLISGIDDIKTGLANLDETRVNITEFENEAAKEIEKFKKAMAALGESIDIERGDI